MVFAGLDIGSQSTCATIINEKEIMAPTAWINSQGKKRLDQITGRE